jgi:hypothetical protein
MTALAVFPYLQTFNSFFDIIPSLNGHDPVKLVSVSYGVDKKANNKYYGPKVMIKQAYTGSIFSEYLSLLNYALSPGMNGTKVSLKHKKTEYVSLYW